MPISPYDVLAPYQKWERTRRMDRWAQLQTDPPAQSAQSLESSPPEETPPEPEIYAESIPETNDSPAPQLAALPPQPPRMPHRFYDQIIRKHTAAAKSAFTSSTPRL